MQPGLCDACLESGRGPPLNGQRRLCCIWSGAQTDTESEESTWPDSKVYFNDVEWGRWLGDPGCERCATYRNTVYNCHKLAFKHRGRCAYRVQSPDDFPRDCMQCRLMSVRRRCAEQIVEDVKRHRRCTWNWNLDVPWGEEAGVKSFLGMTSRGQGIVLGQTVHHAEIPSEPYIVLGLFHILSRHRYVVMTSVEGVGLVGVEPRHVIVGTDKFSDAMSPARRQLITPYVADAIAFARAGFPRMRYLSELPGYSPRCSIQPDVATQTL